MQKKRWTQSLFCILCMVLIAATALTASGCKGQTQGANSSTVSVPETPPIVKGQGQTVFTFLATDLSGNTTVFEVHTDKTTVGQALLENGLIQGEDSSYGLYVKTVNGITLDYDKDGKYWAFYVNGEYAEAGVDSTNIVPQAVYQFKPE